MLHPYTDHHRCLARLIEWHEKNGRIILAVDFDNTIFDYHKRGHDYRNLHELIRAAKRVGAYIIIFTGNHDEQLIRYYCTEKNKIPFDAINEQAPFLPEKMRAARKIYYNLLLDDSAGLESAVRLLQAYIETVENKHPTF